MPAVHFFAAGRVQGVWFRSFTQRTARGLGLTGWVRNLRDGRVEGWAEGPRDKLDALVAAVSVGPDLALVEHLEVEEQPAKGHIDFTTRQTA